MEPRSNAMIDASGPNEPPVMISGPESVAVRIDSSVSPPDTANPKTFPCVKFHAQWMPIGNQSEFVYLYATPSRTPASMAIATELQMLALGLIMWAKPKIKADMPKAHQRPNLSSIILNMRPLAAGYQEIEAKIYEYVGPMRRCKLGVVATCHI